MQILLIEDEAALREVIEYHLARVGYKVLSLGNANDALIAMEEAPPDLVLLDLMLPGLQGLQFLDIFRQKNKATPVIIISARNAEEDIIKALERGADDYLPKPFGVKLLETKIKVAFRRKEGIKEEEGVFENSGIRVEKDTHRAMDGERELSLTQKEFDLLSLFLRKPEKVFTRNQLLSIVWGYDSELNSRTVDVHVAMLRKKLESKGSRIKTVPKIGYLWDPKPAGQK
jgi:two-component system phosphate regulon response regulator PhoB